MLFPQAWRISAILPLLFSILLGCSSEQPVNVPDVSIETSPTVEKKTETQEPDTRTSIYSDSTNPALAESSANPLTLPEVELRTNKGVIRLRLFRDKAPLTVDNFLNNYLAKSHYDGTTFHYVDQGFMILGGLYTADKQAKATQSVIPNEANNGLKNKRGMVAMSRDPSFINSSTCQFFINLVDNQSLDFISTKDSEDFGYCVFGEVISGMEVVDQIAQVPVENQPNFAKTPIEPVVIQSAVLIKK